MVLERKLMKMVQVMWEYSKMEREMVKVHTITLMETSMKGNGRMGNIMVKEHTHTEKGNGKGELKMDKRKLLLYLLFFSSFFPYLISYSHFQI